MVRLVLFDIDGTLIRTGGAGVRAFARAFQTEFQAADGFERLKFAGRTDLGLVREFFGFNRIAPTEANFQRFFECYVFWLDHLLQQREAEVCAGVGHFLRELQAMPHPPLLGLLTGNIRLGAEIKLRHCDLWEVFETGAFGDEHEERDCLAALAQQRGSRILGHPLPGDEVLVVGDTAHDIRCGQAIGARVLAVATGGASLTELEAHRPHWAVADLEAIRVSEVVN